MPSSKNSPALQGLERFTQEWMDVTSVVLIAGGEDVGHAWVAKGKQGGMSECATRCEAGSWD